MAGEAVQHFRVDVVLWAISRRTVITVTDVRARWSVCRTTAYRWVEALNDARERAQGLQQRHRTPVPEPDRERQLTTLPAAGMGGASFMKQDAVESSDSRNPVQVRERLITSENRSENGTVPESLDCTGPAGCRVGFGGLETGIRSYAGQANSTENGMLREGDVR